MLLTTSGLRTGNRREGSGAPAVPSDPTDLWARGGRPGRLLLQNPLPSFSGLKQPPSFILPVTLQIGQGSAGTAFLPAASAGDSSCGPNPSSEHSLTCLAVELAQSWAFVQLRLLAGAPACGLALRLLGFFKGCLCPKKTRQKSMAFLGPALGSRAASRRTWRADGGSPRDALSFEKSGRKPRYSMRGVSPSRRMG